MPTEVKIKIVAEDQASGELQSINKNLQDFGKTAQDIGRPLRNMGLAVTAGVTAPLVGFISTSAIAAARVDELVIANDQLAKAAGLSGEYVQEQVKSIRDMGIEAAASQQIAAKFMTAQLDLADAAGLARIAQDQAVISGENSTETMMRLTDALITGNSQMFRSMNMTLDLSAAYQDMATELGKSVNELTEVEKVQARVNAVMEYGTTITGTYEAAMDDAFKQMGSFRRMQNDIAVEAGQYFTPALNTAVFGMRDLLVTVHEMVSEGGALEPVLAGWGEKLDSAAGLIGKADNALQNMSPTTLATIGDLTALTAVMGPLLLVGGQTVIWAGKLAAAMGTTAGAIAGPAGLIAAYVALLVHTKNYNDELARDIDATTIAAQTYDDYAEALKRAANEQGLLINAAGNLVTAQGAIIEKNFLLSEGNWEQERSVAQLLAAYEKYGASIEIVTEDLSAYFDEAGNAIQITGSLATESYGLAEATDAVVNATNNADAAMRNYTESLLFKLAAEHLSDEAALALAYSMGLVDERTVYATEKINEWAQMLADEQITVETYNSWVSALGDSLGRITDRSATISINWRETGQPSPMAMQYAAPWISGGFASGGMVLPKLQPAAAGFWVGEAGPEPFFPAQAGRILSNTQAKEAIREGRGGVGDIYVNIYTDVNLADRAFVEEQLAPYIRDGIQKEMIRG